MTKGRIEAFSDGVLAILITIMVLELKIPKGGEVEALKPLWPIFLSYVLSFIYIGIYWNNHHHLFQAVNIVKGAVLWANLHLLFWLSLIPFATGWMGEYLFGVPQVMLYGVVLFGAAVAYAILVKVLLYHHADDSSLANAIGRDLKGNVSLALYAAGIGLAYVSPIISCALYTLVAIMWLVPDRRIEREIEPD